MQGDEIDSEQRRGYPNRFAAFRDLSSHPTSGNLREHPEH
jgi:hypothetical protein